MTTPYSPNSAIPALYDGSSIDGVMKLFYSINKNPTQGTGILQLVKQGKNMMGPILPNCMIEYCIAYQFNLFGGYPKPRDVPPSALFLAIYSLLFLGHITIFIINTTRGHNFPLSLAFAFYCVVRIVGFAMRLYWAENITAVGLGIANEVLLILANVLLVSFNLILAQRIFTWRHPVGGSRKLFWNFMITIYLIVGLIIVMTIYFAAGPYIFFLSGDMYKKYIQVNQASSVLIVSYSLTAMSLIGLAFFFKPTRKDENLYTYQPWWIESFSFTYFVRKNAAQENAIGFMKRNSNHRHAKRVIAATHHHYNMVQGLTNQRGTLKHNTSIILVTVSTIIIFIGSLLRCIVTLQGKYNKDAGPASSIVAMYLLWGAGEAVVMMMYLFFRVDLRFYRPDRLPKQVRSIITANQSIPLSDTEEDEAHSNYNSSCSEYESESETNVDYKRSEKKLVGSDYDGDDGSEFRF